MEIKDTVAVVVGGASGMARATAENFSSAGGRVAIFDLPESAGASVAKELPGEARFYPVNVTDDARVEEAIGEVMNDFAAIHIGINVAGGQVGGAKRTVSRSGPHSLDDFRKTIELNLISTFNLLRLQADCMSKNEANEDGERGVVINTASIAAFEGQIGQISYTAAKGGIAAMCLTAARDLGAIGVRVLAIAPSLFDTGLVRGAPQEMKDQLVADAAFPKRMGKPEEYARLARAIVENPMLNGQTIRLDAGQRFRPKG